MFCYYLLVFLRRGSIANNFSSSEIEIRSVYTLTFSDPTLWNCTMYAIVIMLGTFIKLKMPFLCSPIFAKIVHARARTSIYALDRSHETITASFVPMLVGSLAQRVFGYKSVPEGASTSGEIETDRQNAASLAKAMYTAIGIPMVICCSIYSFLYFTYPRDRDRVLLQQIHESRNLPYEEQQPLLEHDEHRLLSVNSLWNSVVKVLWKKQNLEINFPLNTYSIRCLH